MDIQTMTRTLITILALATLAACQTPAMQSGPNAEVTYDGLVRVDNTRIDNAWVRPGMDLAAYDSVMLEGAGIRFRSVRDINPVTMSNLQGFPVDAEQLDRFCDAMIALNLWSSLDQRR